MEFTAPTTKDEMYNTLYYLYRHYRMLRNDFQNVERQTLSLPRISYFAKSDSELYKQAEILLAEQHQREIDKKRNQLIEDKSQMILELDSITNNYEQNVQAIEEKYEKVIDELRQEAIERGVEGSYTLDKVCQIKGEKARVLAQMEVDKNDKLFQLNEKIAQREQEIQGVEDSFAELHELSKQAKKAELIKEQKELVFQYIKFNNSQEEKEIKYANTLIQLDANLELTYMKIKAEGLSKEILFNMGYYTDVLRCINQYYSTMSKIRAYNDILYESDLGLFLDDEYQNLVYKYRIAALDEQENNGLANA